MAKGAALAMAATAIALAHAAPAKTHAYIADRRRTDCILSGKYGCQRWLARCTVDRADIGAAVVARGLAWVYRRYPDG